MSVREQRSPRGGAETPADERAAPRSGAERLAWRVASRLRDPDPTLFWAVVAVGVLLRVARYLDNRSLWLDESFLAINLIDKSFSDLFGDLQFLQTAPVGFLVAEKGVISVLGDGEYALRLLPLLSGIAALVLLQHVGRRLLPPAAALLALVLFATNPVLLYQSSELKPYSSDVAIALMLVALALYAAKPEAGRLRLLLLAVVAPVVIWFSFPAVLVLGGIAVYLAVEALRAGDRRRLAIVAVLSVTWLASFGVLYAVASTNVTRTSDAIFGESSHGTDRVTRVVQNAWSSFVDPGGFQDGTNGLAVLLFAVGVIAIVRRRELGVLTLLVMPIGFAVLAALVDKYPLGGRFSMFLVPFLVLLVGAGAAAAVKASRFPLLAVPLLAVFLFAAPAGRAAWDLFDPPRREHVKPLLQRLAREWQPGDALYVYRHSQYALRYYGACGSCEPWPGDFPWPLEPARDLGTGEEFAPALESDRPTFIVGEQYREPTDSVQDVAALPANRVWLLFSHVSSPRGLNEESLMVAALEERGEALGSWRESSASLYLYELKAR